jgi:5-oxoprolinase (ATP-hydrolysing) subunit C
LGYRSSGVPVSGAMDAVALDIANRVVGNDPGAAALEWALGGGVIRFTDRSRFVLSGATAESMLDEQRIDGDRAYDATAGAMLTIGRFTTGRFLYIAIGGGIDVPIVLGSRSTYTPARLGGHHGRLIRTGDRLPVGALQACETDRMVIDPRIAHDAPLRITRGPDANRFTLHGWTIFVSGLFRVSTASDRTGYRLDGPLVEGTGTDGGPSGPVCPGVVQVPPSGQPLVLMADAPTIGGYPVLAVVSSADLPRLAQRRPGDEVRFTEKTANS